MKRIIAVLTLSTMMISCTEYDGKSQTPEEMGDYIKRCAEVGLSYKVRTDLYTETQWIDCK